MKDLGSSKDGYSIVARGVAEDNSGVVVEIMPPRGALPGIWEMRLYMPIFDEDDPTSEEGTTRKTFTDKAAAVQQLKEEVGIARLERDGPGF